MNGKCHEFPHAPDYNHVIKNAITHMKRELDRNPELVKKIRAMIENIYDYRAHFIAFEREIDLNLETIHSATGAKYVQKENGMLDYSSSCLTCNDPDSFVKATQDMQRNVMIVKQYRYAISKKLAYLSDAFLIIKPEDIPGMALNSLHIDLLIDYVMGWSEGTSVVYKDPYNQFHKGE